MKTDTVMHKLTDGFPDPIKWSGTPDKIERFLIIFWNMGKESTVWKPIDVHSIIRGTPQRKLLSCLSLVKRSHELQQALLN